MSIAPPWFGQCSYCNHVVNLTSLFDKPGVCRAFPNGIPDALWQNGISHNQSYPGDAGILLSPKEDAEAKLHELLDSFIGMIEENYGDINDPKLAKLMDEHLFTFDIDQMLELIEWVKAAKKREEDTSCA